MFQYLFVYERLFSIIYYLIYYHSVENELKLAWVHFVDFLKNANSILSVSSPTAVLDIHRVLRFAVPEGLLRWRRFA